jgi:DNA polymerase-3 subunit gamma/tau
MSYLVFARKWRPMTFSEVAAQEHITVTLQNAVSTGRIGHAYLFSGPRGVGKTTTARILAKGLNCENGPTPEPCLECSSCRQIAAGSHMDVLEIDGASNRGIDEIRDLREKTRYAAAAGGYKIYIIDEVHMLTKEAFNALLKTLEEPPEKVIFIFATTEPRKVPATILSRCQRFDFRRIPFRTMADYISAEASREGITVSRDALGLVCRASGGSMRDALSLMDQLVSFAGNTISAEIVSRLLGLVETDLLAGVASAVLSSDAPAALDLLEEASRRGYSVEEFTEAFSGFLRNMMLAASGAGKGISDLSESEMETVRSCVAGVPDIAVLNVLRVMAGASAQVREGADPRITMEGALLTAARLSSVFQLDNLPRVKVSMAAPAVPFTGKPAPGAETSSAVTETDGAGSRSDTAGAVSPAAPKTGMEEPSPEEPAPPGRKESNDVRKKENEDIKEIAGLFDLIPEPGGEGAHGEP